MAVLLLFLLKDCGELSDRLRRIDRPGRIVRRVDQHCHRPRVQNLVKLLKIDLKLRRVGRHNPQHSASLSHIMIILREIRSEGDHLVARLRDRPDRMCDRARSPRRHEQMLRRVVHAKRLIQKVRKSRAHRRDPL